MSTVIGRVKWFSTRRGFGVIDTLNEDGSIEGSVFVHHTQVSVADPQYRYLVEGEYVQYTQREQTSKVDGDGGESDGDDGSSTHSADDGEQTKYEAVGVKGVYGGMLMCETRKNRRVEVAKSRAERRQTTDGSEHDGAEQSHRRQPRRNVRGGRGGRGRGGGRGRRGGRGGRGRNM